MKKIITLLCISILFNNSTAQTTPMPYIDIKKEIGTQRFSTLNQRQKTWISNILKDLDVNERKHFFVSFNHHYDMTNEFRQETTVNIKLSKLQYHDSSRISPNDIDHIINTAQRHARHY